MVMGAIGWIVSGLIVGYIANTLVNKRGEGLAFDLLLGGVGAVIGGWIFNAAGTAGSTGINLWSAPVAVFGAVVLLAVWHAVRRSACHAVLDKNEQRLLRSWRREATADPRTWRKVDVRWDRRTRKSTISAACTVAVNNRH